MSNRDLEIFIEILSTKKYIVSFTGAGISSESGIPTFRDKNGLWRRFKPEELASFEAFLRDPVKVWKWYIWRMKNIVSAKPNYAHLALALLEKRNRLKTIITQNIDGLHHKAGSKRVIEIHGSIWRVRCISCNYKSKLNGIPDENDLPIKCPRCGNLLRPDVVWFGEALDSRLWYESIREAVNSDLFIVIGTSGTVYPAAELPFIAKDNGSYIVVIDPNKTAFDNIADLRIWSKSSQFFKKVLDYGAL